eukprot:TRINITY_DN4803_c0_g1_i1.p1 TRINITY_DN4803_c0_g1~~TRINITY_DN4803_c0_g1_i1.p1  ORF type:complete len:213 (+),score=70.06 TRINITY_DN4803_c0_g1_i1:50-688(+)
MSGGPEASESLDLSAYPESELVAALIDAARYGDEEDVVMIGKILDFKGELVDAEDEQGRSALHMACANGHVSVVKLLLGRKVKPKIDAQNKEGSTPMHFAAMNGSKEIVQDLLNAGYNVAIRNKFNRKPIDEAFDRSHTALEDLLLLKDPDVEAELKQHESRLNPSDLQGLEPPKDAPTQAKPSTSLPKPKKDKDDDAPPPPTEQLSMMTMD